MSRLEATEGLSYLFPADTKKPTIVIIPDAFHTAAHFGPLTWYLGAQGYSSFALRMPSTGEKPGTKLGGMAEDVATIRRALEELIKSEEDIILVMHSYGAVPGCQAVAGLERSFEVKEGKRGGLTSLVFIGGLLVEEGESISSTMLALGEKALPEYAENKV